ncbi:hypothetical protein NHX12_028241 [Muraenolepis orangiensis]|uniref:NTR domain-containing protein n=1 Tax=Muraenolepis orangiensis TaxID=630683 RepID=A0A9Q0ECX2_9TELE|nr:hypothetical protein NHX12_028241 [Muraenolepis orangiensis]
MGNMLSVILEPEGLRKLIDRPQGSSDSGLDRLLPLIHVYRYLEENSRWNILGTNINDNSFKLRQKINEGVVNVFSFRVKEEPSLYSNWQNKMPSTRVVGTLGLLEGVIPVDKVSLGASVDWLIKRAQNTDGSFRELSPDSKKVATDHTDLSVYLTSLVLLSVTRARKIQHNALHSQFQEDAMQQAAHYISQHAMGQPDQSSGLTVETTAYVLLTAVHKWRSSYINPILSWLTQDQQYGGGFYSTEDAVLTLEAITEYSKKLSRVNLDQDIRIRYKGEAGNDRADVKLREAMPIATPIQVLNYGDITVSTGYGGGVSHFMEGEIPAIVYYELRGDKVVIQTESVPSDIFRCVGFRVRQVIAVESAASSIFRVYENHVRGSVCEKQFQFRFLDIQRLCLRNKCQCMTAASYKVKIGSAMAEGDFMTYTATVVQVLKQGDMGVKVDLVKKATCSSVDLPKDSQFLVQGSRGSEVLSDDTVRYRFPLDSDTILEQLPSCSPLPCSDTELSIYEEDLQLDACLFK